MTISLLLASNNPHKVEELRSIIGEDASTLHIQLLLPDDIEGFPRDIAETGTTLEENAYLKASAVFQSSVLSPQALSSSFWACVADDTGLEVGALGGKPGVRSARYAGNGASFEDNRTALLEALHGIPFEQRTARFRTVLCYQDTLRTLFVEGICEGWIADHERGSEGFGYDAVFVPRDNNPTYRTFAEMTPEEKNAASHRARALSIFVRQLIALQEE
jgi:XTP/dITP diphosphohydrolase